MALVAYAVYTAPADDVWAALSALAAGSGGLRVESEARTLRYNAWGGLGAFPQRVEAGVFALGDARCAVSITVGGRMNRVALTERPRQRALIEELTSDLDSRFPLESQEITHEPQGCLVGLLLLAAGCAGIVVAGQVVPHQRRSR